MPTYTDREIIKNRQSGQAETYNCSDPKAEIAKIHSTHTAYDKGSDDATAATATSETYTGRVNLNKVRVKAVYYTPTTGGITADASNNATITIKWRDSAAANPVTVATYTTDVAGGSATQGVPKAMTLTQANTICAAGGSFTITITKAGTGVVVRAGSFTLELENV